MSGVKLRFPRQSIASERDLSDRMFVSIGRRSEMFSRGKRNFEDHEKRYGRRIKPIKLMGRAVLIEKWLWDVECHNLFASALDKVTVDG